MNNTITLPVEKLSNQENNIVNPKAKTVAYRPTITVVSGENNQDNQIVSSSLNHYTSLTVGVFEQQYAILISTNKSTVTTTAVSPKVSKTLDLIQTQPFADEVEDEIVEETIQVKPTEIISEEIIKEETVAVEIEENLPVSIQNEEDEMLPLKEDEFETKGTLEDIVTPSSFAFNKENVDAAYLLGKFNPATHQDFTKVHKKYASRSGMYIRKDVYQAFLNMYEAAKKDNVDLKILSATRSFSGQKRIWEAKWTGKRKVGGADLSQAIPFGTDRAKKILEYSAMPGTSRHHWGTDLDLCALNNAFFDKAIGKKIYEWLSKNASKYGFYQPYTERSTSRTTGHNEEKWHWSYLPVAKVLTQKYTQILTNDKIVGFLGEAAAVDIQILENYVLGISSECK